MKSLISEFSYGFALTDELVNGHGTAITAAPYFPSLYDEGQEGFGYDLKLSRPGFPLFLQFKLSQYMKTRAAKEYKAGLLDPPFYRMPLRPTKHSRQHDQLLELEDKGHEVYYCAPAFQLEHELNDAYLTRQVRQRSIWVKPSYIGPLPDDKEHTISFKDPSTDAPYLFSKPKKLSGSIAYNQFEKRIVTSIEGMEKQGNKPWVRLLQDMEDILYPLGTDPNPGTDSRSIIARENQDDMELKLSLLNRITELSSLIFQSQLFIVSLKE